MKIISLLSLAALPLFGQVYNPPPDNEKSSSNNSSSSSSSSSDSGGDKKESSSPLGNEVPIVDPSSETVTFNGKNFAITDNRLFAARFERYLNEPEDSSVAAVDYRKTIDEILASVSPLHPGGPDFAAAVRLLPRASSYSGDGRLCDSLMQAVYTAVLAKKDVSATRKLSLAMDDEKKRLIYNMDVKSDRTEISKDKGSGKDEKDKGKGGKSAENTVSVAMNSLEYKDAVMRIAEIEALKKSNTAKNEVQLVQAKVQYQALMVQFFMQRRFQHVLMAARFYNEVFKDGDGKLYLDKDSDVSKAFSETLGVSPTVSMLDSLASEAIRDCDKGVEAFQYLSEKNELESASKRLSEAYAVGEFMPSIRTLPRDKKRKVLEFTREAYKLISAIDTKDYTVAAEINEKLKSMATDYNPNKAAAAVATFSRVSNTHIMQAKTYVAQKDMEKAREEIKKAMEVWPQNPKLSEFDQLIESGTSLVQAQNDFDRLLSENNYRQIFADQYRIAPALAGDEKRTKAFKEIITNLTTIESCIAKANEFSKMGQDYAAWEQMAEVREKFPDDPKLGREIEKLAPKVADFTKALDKATQFEKRTPVQVGSSLSWYLKAQQIYGDSKLAEAGIKRVMQLFSNN